MNYSAAHPFRPEIRLLRHITPDGQRLGYTYNGPGEWRFVHVDGDRRACVGPHYRREVELLADSDRYARVFGFPS